MVKMCVRLRKKVAYVVPARQWYAKRRGSFLSGSALSSRKGGRKRKKIW